MYRSLSSRNVLNDASLVSSSPVRCPRCPCGYPISCPPRLVILSTGMSVMVGAQASKADGKCDKGKDEVVVRTSMMERNSCRGGVRTDEHGEEAAAAVVLISVVAAQRKKEASCASSPFGVPGSPPGPVPRASRNDTEAPQNHQRREDRRDRNCDWLTDSDFQIDRDKGAAGLGRPSRTHSSRSLARTSYNLNDNRVTNTRDLEAAQHGNHFCLTGESFSLCSPKHGNPQTPVIHTP